MPSTTEYNSNGLQQTNYHVEQVFLGRNFYEKYEYTNSTGSPVTINIGRTLGQVLATSKVLPQASTSTDGSEQPMAIAAQKYVVADGETVDVYACIKGDVNENAVSLAVGDTMATAIRTASTGGGTIRSLIIRNTGIMLVESLELSRYDNQI